MSKEGLQRVRSDNILDCPGNHVVTVYDYNTANGTIKIIEAGGGDPADNFQEYSADDHSQVRAPNGWVSLQYYLDKGFQKRRLVVSP